MITQRDDDYLICREYMERIGQVSTEYPDFITFQHPNQNYYFAWVNGQDIILRSEAYPDEERMIRGIKAIIKNRDLKERYSVEEAHGVCFLLLWGGGDHQVHTGNMESHNEIGRSCPKKSREDLLAMMLFKGKSFADAIIPMAAIGGMAATAAAVATTVMASVADTPVKEEPVYAVPAAAAASTAPPISTGSGFNWKWLLPLLLILPLFLWWKSCNKTTVGGDLDLSGANSGISAGAVDTAEVAETKEVQNAASTTPSAPDCDLNWIFFDYDKYDIQSSANEELKTMADILKNNVDFSAVLSAHTDAKGTDEYNAALSQNRANAAKNVLVSMGIDDSRIQTTANSESAPIAVNTDDDSGRHYNRRVELRVIDKSGKEICRSIPPKVPTNLQQ